MAKTKNIRDTAAHERPSFKFQLTDSDLEQGSFRGVASVFGSKVGNSGPGWDGSIVERGAFEKTLRERGGGKIRLLWQHDTDYPIGVITAAQETAEGLEITGKFSLTTKGREALVLLRDSALDGLSIGFDAIKWELVKKDSETLRLLKEIRLWEVSVVTFPADPLASVREVAEIQEDDQGQEQHSIMGFPMMGLTDSSPGASSPIHLHEYSLHLDESGEACGSAWAIAGHSHMITMVSLTRGETEASDGHYHKLMKSGEMAEMLSQFEQKESYVSEKQAVVAFQDLPLTTRNRGWDSAAAESRIRNWAGGNTDLNEMDWGKYRKAFLWFDSTDPEKVGSYKLPIADIIGGTLTCVPRAVFASAGAMMGARGGTMMPEADEAGVKAHIAKYYKKMAKEFDDDTIKPPWEKEAGDPVEQLAAFVVDMERQEGRVLSGKNKTLVQEVVAALQKLLAAAEKEDESQDIVLELAQHEHDMREKFADLLVL